MTPGGQFLNCQVTEKGGDLKLELADFVIPQELALAGAERLLHVPVWFLYPQRKGYFKKHRLLFHSSKSNSAPRLGMFSPIKNNLTN